MAAELYKVLGIMMMCPQMSMRLEDVDYFFFDVSTEVKSMDGR
jgi:hypothetical protein